MHLKTGILPLGGSSGGLFLARRPGTGEPVLLVHGSVLDGRSFTELARHLGDRPIWIPDLRCHGRSPGRDAYGWSDHLGDLATLIRHIGSPCDIVGVSMGGMLAVELALSHPDLVRSLCLLGVAVDGETVATRVRAGWFDQAIRSQGLASLIPGIARLFLGQTGADQERLRSAVEEQLATAGDAGALHCIAALMTRRDLRDLLPSLDAPVLCLWGGQDEVITPDRCLDTARRCGDGTWTELPEAGHLIANLCPAEVGGRIVEWWSGPRPER